MIRSMQTAITGMNAFQQALNVTSNNIANASTTAFKSQRAMFTDLLYTNTMGGNAGDLFALTNPMSVGSGVRLGSVSTDFSAGGQVAGGLMDAALTGDGFFIVGDRNGGTMEFTRSGNFARSSDGRIVNGNGQYVLGFPTDANGNIVPTPTPMPIEIEIGRALPGVASTGASLSGNIPSRPNFVDGEYTRTEQVVVFNSAGERIELEVRFIMTEEEEDGVGTGRTESISVEVFAPDGETLLDEIAEVPLNEAGLFDWSGLSLDISGAINNGEDGEGVALDLSRLTTLPTNRTVSSTQDGGNAARVVVGYGIGDGGNVMLIYSDGSTEVVAQLAVATFPNNNGLMQQGNGNFVPDLAAGQIAIGVAGQNGAGNIRGGALESSNVDLAAEFVDLMVFQRGFQGNTRVISISADILSEVVNLVR